MKTGLYYFPIQFRISRGSRRSRRGFSRVRCWVAFLGDTCYGNAPTKQGLVSALRAYYPNATFLP